MMLKSHVGKTLGWELQKRGDVWCVVWDQGGVRPASDQEVALWLTVVKATTPRPVVKATTPRPVDQRSLTDQLQDLVLMANRAGMYDAADYITARLNERKS